MSTLSIRFGVDEGVGVVDGVVEAAEDVVARVLVGEIAHNVLGQVLLRQYRDLISFK
jgi:hypothetical protein